MKFTPLQALCVLLYVAVASPLAAQTSDDPASTQLVNETPQVWFVELASPPTVDGTSAGQITAEQAAFRGAAQGAGLKYTERRAYQTLFNGLSVKVAPADIGKLTRIPGVQNIYPVHTVQFGTTDTPDQQDWLQMTGADSAQNVLGVHGDGIRLAIIDTGIDYTHPDLGGCTSVGPGCRVEMGYDFVGDSFNGTNDPMPDPDPMDCNGHGTHVAGIAGADGHGLAGHVTGVAPHVKFHAYRVFGCTGGTPDDIVLAALEKAYLDGTDIISMSLGGAYDDWAESPTAAASTRLVQKGIVVVAAAGNSGSAGGTYATGSPSTGTKVISVASFENLTVKQQSFTISPDNKAIGYIPAVGAPSPPTSGSLPMKAAPDAAGIGCTAPAPGTYAGVAALIKRGTCSFYVKASNAQAAGASAVVLSNNVVGFVNPTVAGSPPITIPVVAITLADGDTIRSRLSSGPVTMTWTNQLTSVPNPTAGLVSTFSSFGPTAELDFKPDLGAPGGNIFSTWPVAMGSYATLSGTSMATPHVAGSVALLLQAHPHTPPALARDVLQNNAVPANWNGNPGLGFLDNVHVQGAGLIHIDNTILNGVSVSPGKLALGDSAAGPATRTLTFSNGGGSAITYDLSHVAALTTGSSEFTISEFPAPASASFSAPSVTVPAGGSASVNVTITAPATPSMYTYGGYLVATPEGGGFTLRVPYMGVVDYQAVNVLGLRGSNFPRLTHGDLTAVTDGAVFNLTNGDLPTIVLQLDHPTRTLSANVFSAPASPGGPLGKSWHQAFKLDYLPRNSSSTGLLAFAFDGTTTNGNKLNTLPPGSYVIVLTALQPLGDSSNPRSVETWQSPVFTITR
jgi:subtilisin family serine protease